MLKRDDLLHKQDLLFITLQLFSNSAISNDCTAYPAFWEFILKPRNFPEVLFSPTLFERFLRKSYRILTEGKDKFKTELCISFASITTVSSVSTC